MKITLDTEARTITVPWNFETLFSEKKKTAAQFGVVTDMNAQQYINNIWNEIMKSPVEGQNFIHADKIVRKKKDVK